MSDLTRARIDATGFHAPDFETILNRRIEEYKAIYGDDTYLDNDSQDGSLIRVLALAEYDTNALALEVYRSFSPSSAQGDALTSNVKINGIGRDGLSYSTAPIRIVGRIGTTITGGMVGGDDDVKWLLPEVVTIPYTGECIVTATAAEPGDKRAAAGDIYRILTPTQGWQDAVNTEAATPGKPVETDAALRQRQEKSTALPSLTVIDGVRGAGAQVDGVLRSEVYENDTHETDEDGIPAHSIAVVVEGGDVDEIAYVVGVKKTPGAYTYGDISVETADRYGVPKTIRLFRSKEYRVGAQIVIRAYNGYKAATGQLIQEAVAEYINTMRIGMDVLRSRLICPITQSEPVKGERTFDVDIDDLQLSVDGGEFLPENVTIPFNGMAASSSEEVIVRVMRKENGVWVNA